MITDILMERSTKLLESVDSLHLITGQYWYHANQTKTIIQDLLEKQEVLLGAIRSFVRGVEGAKDSDPIKSRLNIHLSRHKRALVQVEGDESSLAVIEAEQLDKDVQIMELTETLIQSTQAAIRWHASDAWRDSGVPRERKAWEERMDELRNQLVDAVSSSSLKIPVDEETCAHCGEVTPMTKVVGRCRQCGARLLACSACTQSHCDVCDDNGSHFCERLY